MIYIDIKMPECCYDCMFYRDDDTKIYCMVIENKLVEEDKFDKRHENCPLKEVKE